MLYYIQHTCHKIIYKLFYGMYMSNTMSADTIDIFLTIVEFKKNAKIILSIQTKKNIVVVFLYVFCD